MFDCSTLNNFNIFNVLEKDNKELIHSAFIAYLFERNNDFRQHMLKIPDVQYGKPVLECCPPGLRKIRIDIEITAANEKHIIVIENKFKSFPYPEQLTKYSKAYKQYYHNYKIHKFLFCFDKNIINFKINAEWQIYDYSDVLHFIQNHFDFGIRDDETIFVKHYYYFLSDYLYRYRLYVANIDLLLVKNLNKEDKFWLRIIYSILHLKFVKLFHNEEIDYVVNPGNTSIPLIDIIPKKWQNITKQKLMIQLQGLDLKLYIHSANKEFILSIINLSMLNSKSVGLEFKRIDKRDAKSFFIHKLKIDAAFGNRKNIVIDDLVDLVKNFYFDIEENIIEKYLHDHKLINVPI